MMTDLKLESNAFQCDYSLKTLTEVMKPVCCLQQHLDDCISGRLEISDHPLSNIHANSRLEREFVPLKSAGITAIAYPGVLCLLRNWNKFEFLRPVQLTRFNVFRSNLT